MKIGIIGGSGFDDQQMLEGAHEQLVTTKYGEPSSPLLHARINGVDIVALARHGKGHTITPTNVNNRANIAALKDAGCTHILATTACGSLRKDIGRGDIVILDQFIDFTRHRDITFHDSFSEGIKHVSVAEPFDKSLRKALIDSGQALGLKLHDKGTVITIEGPRFSTKAESRMFHALGADVINMSTAPEAILANEAGISYAVVALATDYDCLFDDVAPVSWEEVLRIFKENIGKLKQLLTATVASLKVVAHAGDIRSASDIKSHVRTIPDWPKKGIMFRDITTLLKNNEGFNTTIALLAQRYAGHVAQDRTADETAAATGNISTDNTATSSVVTNSKIDLVAGIESRGFIIGSALAHRLNVGFIPLRKAGKLPAERISRSYDLEYGKDMLEMHKDAIIPGQRVLLVDDLLATGGTSCAAAELIASAGGVVHGCAFVIELPTLRGREKLESKGHNVFSLMQFEGE